MTAKHDARLASEALHANFIGCSEGRNNAEACHDLQIWCQTGHNIGVVPDEISYDHI